MGVAFRTKHDMVARLQQAISLSMLFILVWCSWVLLTHPGPTALLGILFVLSGYPFVLACEFALLRRSMLKSSVPPPSAHALLRAWAGEVRHGAAVFFWRQPFRSAAVPDDLTAKTSHGRGMVFVHGLFCNRGFWTPWMQEARRLGLPYVAIDLEPLTGDIDGYATAVEHAVQRMMDATGLQPVVICHSMGGLAVRAWLRTVSNPHERIARVITIASPHAGTWMARFGHGVNARQMALNNAWLQQLGSTESTSVRQLFVCWHSDCDNIVFPSSTATLPDADNRLVPGVAHVALAFNTEVLHASLAIAANSHASSTDLESTNANAQS